jgi:hypothetical protein
MVYRPLIAKGLKTFGQILNDIEFVHNLNDQNLILKARCTEPK